MDLQGTCSTSPSKAFSERDCSRDLREAARHREEFVLAELDRILEQKFGRQLCALPVRVQRESPPRAAAGEFAEIQGRGTHRKRAGASSGAEISLSSATRCPSAAFRSPAKIDRVEIHRTDRTLTAHSRITKPRGAKTTAHHEDVHFGRPEEGTDFPEAELNGKTQTSPLPGARSCNCPLPCAGPASLDG